MYETLGSGIGCVLWDSGTGFTYSDEGIPGRYTMPASDVENTGDAASQTGLFSSHKESLYDAGDESIVVDGQRPNHLRLNLSLSCLFYNLHCIPFYSFYPLIYYNQLQGWGGGGGVEYTQCNSNGMVVRRINIKVIVIRTAMVLKGAMRVLVSAEHCRAKT